MRTLLLASALFAGLLGSLAAAPFPPPSPVPYHAFCRTLWLFATPCPEISTKLAQTIQNLKYSQYTLVSATPLAIKANHTSKDALQEESITFTLTPTVLAAGCRVSAQSASLGFASLLDGGLNYCNLYNVLSTSSLASTPGFMEMTNEWACIGYGMTTCKA